MFGLTLAILLTGAQPPVPQAPGRPITTYLQQTTFQGQPRGAAIRLARSADPLTNGARIGAIVGGVVTAAAIGWLCFATHEKGDPSCFGPIVLWSAIGAGVGAGAGAGIDALFGRKILVQGSVRF